MFTRCTRTKETGPEPIIIRAVPRRGHRRLWSLNGSGKVGYVSFTRNKLSELFYFFPDPFHFFLSCERAFSLVLGSFVGQTRHSGDHREDFVTDQKFRVGRPGAAVCRKRIPILTENCILRILLSSDFLQIRVGKQIDDRIQKSGLDSKGLSAIESNSNLAKTLYEDYSFEG